jgi:hypothetical protein
MLVLGLSGCTLLLDWLASDRFTLPDDYEADPASTYGIQFELTLDVAPIAPAEVLVIYPDADSNTTHFELISSISWSSSEFLFKYSDHVFLTVIYNDTGNTRTATPVIRKDGLALPLGGAVTSDDINTTIEAYLNQ